MHAVLLAAAGKVKWGAALVAVVLAGASINHALLPGQYVLNVPVQNAAGIYPGSDVDIAGSRVGSVTTVTLQGGLALISAAIDPAHSPVHTDATVSLRPKSLLGERYLALDPGKESGSLSSGSTLPPTQVVRSVDLEEVINTFDQPTRQKLQTLIVELGGGLAGRGAELNGGLHYGRQDLDDLAAITDTLAQRDAQLQQVIQDLDVVTTELARADRSQQLTELIKNTERLTKNLADQDAQLKLALVETNAALGRTANGLDGTSGHLASIAVQLPYTVRQGDVLLADLGTDADILQPHLGSLGQGLDWSAVAFSGRDAYGYATRINLNAGCWTIESCPSGPVPPRSKNVQPPPKGPPAVSSAPTPGPYDAVSMSDGSEMQGGTLGFLMGTKR